MMNFNTTELTLGIIWLCIGVVFYLVNTKVLHRDVNLELE